MDMNYDINQYMVSVKMSAKKRILVEGRDDKAHLTNLLGVLLSDIKYKVDTVENIRGVCTATNRNNRAKIDFMHGICKENNSHKNLYFFCDREYFKFVINHKIDDFMAEHEIDGNLGFTLGHSFENYFLDLDLIFDAFSYLTDSEFKYTAFSLMRESSFSIFKFLAAVSLAARETGSVGYPMGLIKWDDFCISKGQILFNTQAWIIKNNNQASQRFLEVFLEKMDVCEKSNPTVFSKICRGHTAVVFLQRIFAFCIYENGDDKAVSERDANLFNNIKESIVSGALCEAWLRKVKAEESIYPKDFVAYISE